MAAILEIIFHSFWTFIGTIILFIMLMWLLGIVGDALATVIRAWKR